MHHHAFADLYLRLSLDRDGKTAIERQQHDCEEWAKKNGLTIRQVHIDRGRSGYKHVTRKGFDAAKAALAAGVVGTLIVWKLDRLSRKGMGEIGLLLDQLDKAGGRLISVVDGLDSSKPNARLIMATLSELARAESKTLGERVGHAKQYLRGQGRWIGGQPPYGLMIDQPTGQLAPDPETGVYARLIADDALAGVPLVKIARLLNEHEIPGPRGGLWQVNTLSQLLRSPAFAGLLPETEKVWDDTRGEWKYTGVVRPYRDPETRETVRVGEGIITVGERGKILQLIESRTRYGKGGEKLPRRDPSHLLTGLLFCGVEGCGVRMSFSGNSYVCQGVRLGHSCPGARVLASRIEFEVTQRFLTRIPALEPGHPTLEAIADRWMHREDPEAFAQRDTIETEIADTEGQLSDLEEARYVRGEFSDSNGPERYDRIAGKLRNRLLGLQQRLAELPVPRANIGILLDGYELGEAWKTADDDTRRGLLSLAIDRVTVTRADYQGQRFDPDKRMDIEWAEKKPASA
ncbi:recombinase family protein [Streptomyces sp. NPDC048650]|uniref:recombinase family protein n=1 Tax=Streptomyces sp. NPDC048650 TaxID=3365583 RepID=UPI00371EFFE4